MRHSGRGGQSGGLSVCCLKYHDSTKATHIHCRARRIVLALDGNRASGSDRQSRSISTHIVGARYIGEDTRRLEALWEARHTPLPIKATDIYVTLEDIIQESIEYR